MRTYGYSAEEAVPEVQDQIREILKNEKDLLKKFETFLPGNRKGWLYGEQMNGIEPSRRYIDIDTE